MPESVPSNAEATLQEGCYLVTGGASGIGLAVVERLLAGNKQVAVADLQSERLDAFHQNHPFVKVFAKDLMTPNAPNELVTAVIQECGPIRGFVHAAGFDRMELLHLAKEETLDRLFCIHAKVPILMCGRISKRGNFQENASFVMISSLSAHEGAIGHASYAAAKGALEGFIAPAAAELAKKRIRLNAVVLGVVKTPMSESWISNLDEAQTNALHASYPMGIGTPPDVASMICFLLSNESKWITGQKIVLDGGHSIRL